MFLSHIDVPLSIAHSLSLPLPLKSINMSLGQNSQKKKQSFFKNLF